VRCGALGEGLRFLSDFQDVGKRTQVRPGRYERAPEKESLQKSGPIPGNRPALFWGKVW